MLIRRLFGQLSHAVVLPKPIAPLCASSVVTRHAKSARRPLYQFLQFYPSSSSTRWRARHARDRFAKEAKVQGLKSRAAFKLLEIDSKYRIFSPGQTVIDLGYAPGSWSQVAVTKTSPGGRVVGIDVIPAQPPRGVSTIQGNFLSADVQAEVRAYVQDPQRGRPRKRTVLQRQEDASEEDTEISEQEREELERGYIDLERAARLDACDGDGASEKPKEGEEGTRLALKGRDKARGRTVDVVLSDMSAPWDQTTGLWVKSISNPYNRMMNTSGIAFKDHAGSMVCVEIDLRKGTIKTDNQP